MIEGDVTRLEQIIWNLLNNALKFSPAGNEIRLVLSHDENHARLQVIDHGVGLSHDSLEHIFDLFSQATPQGQPQPRGPGHRPVAGTATGRGPWR